MTTITLELPEDVAAKAREVGLLTPERLTGMLDEALLRQQAGQRFFAAAERASQADGPVLSEDEVVAMIKEMRHSPDGD
ncbi:MAG: hypothetical protein FWG74_00975 [Planctomycetes bacterium]|nr:hypothetical protein [Planctomycetota bacterium]